MITDQGNNIHIVDGKRYICKEDTLLTEWKCPYCGQKELSWKVDMTSKAHFNHCKVKRKMDRQKKNNDNNL